MAHRYARPALAAVALALALPAAAAEKQVEASKIFVRLDQFLKVPPAERNHVAMAYYLRIGTTPLSAPVTLVEGDKRTPIPLAPSGKVLRLPTAAQLETAKVAIGVDPETRVGEHISVEPALPPAADLDARELAAAVAQSGPVIKKIAGILALTVPAPKVVTFAGVSSGEAELTDGRRVPLPVVKGVATYDPAAIPNARRIHLPKVPAKLDLD